MSDLLERSARLLLVEDPSHPPPDLRALLAGSQDPRLEVEEVPDLESAVKRLGRGGIDLLLLDLHLPDGGGVEAFERVSAFAPDVPVVALAGAEDERVARAILQGGAQDFLVRGEVDAATLGRSIRYALERHRLMSALRSLSLIDDLTGLYNRRGFTELGAQHLKLAERSGRGAILLYLDLDRFKEINDTLGHPVGDRALRRVTGILRAAFRRSDIVARLGGDEFAVLALEVSGEDGGLLENRVRDRVRSLNGEGGEPFRLEVSLGLARHRVGQGEGLDELLARADARMYREKRSKEGGLTE